jgi:hypothetical protein
MRRIAQQRSEPMSKPAKSSPCATALAAIVFLVLCCGGAFWLAAKLDAPAKPEQEWTAASHPGWAITSSDPDHARLADAIARDLQTGSISALSASPCVLRVPGNVWRAWSPADRRGTYFVAFYYLVSIGRQGPLEVRDASSGQILAT